jgi:hypothetical protein
MDREPIGTGRLPALGGCQGIISSSIGVDLPIPQKTHPGHDVMVAGLAGAISLRNEIQLRQRWRSGRNHGSTVAWCPPLRRQTRRLEIVRRSLPRNVPPLLTRRVGGLLRLDLLITVDRRSSSAGDLGEADNHDRQHADIVSAREMKDYAYLPTCSGRVRQRLLFLR